MSGRRQPRIKCVLPIRVTGIDREGNPFEQLTCTLDISPRGARISGIRAPLEPDTTVKVFYKNRRALFRVMWVGTEEGRTEHQVGVATADPEAHFWTEIPAVTHYTDEYQVLERQEQEKVAASRAKAPGKTSSPHEVTGRLQATTEELLELAKVLEQGVADATALQQFRQALAYVRNTSWILQQWLELEEKPEERFPLLRMLNTERLRIATTVCNELAGFLTSVKIQLDPALMQQFITAVQQLFLIISAAEESKPATPSNTDTSASAASSSQ